MEIIRKIKINREKTLFELPNQMRVIFHQVRNSYLVHCGLMIGAGSRDENHENNGVAHFIEHALFKATRKRSAFQILNRVEAIGGELNAYTTRERTCYYTITLKTYLERSLELLLDLVFNPKFGSADIEKEKSVIKEEIDMYQDSPDDSIFDDFHEEIFKGHPLGYNILGSKKTIGNFTPETLSAFWKRKYTGNNIVLSIVGTQSPEKIEKLLHKYLSGLTIDSHNGHHSPPDPYHPFDRRVKKDFQQTHIMIGSRAYAIDDEKKYALLLMNNILGGDWMSSRLNMSIREKYAYAYHVNSNYNPYVDTGVFSVHIGTDVKYLDKSINLIRKEMQSLREKGITRLTLNKAKRQVFGHYSMLNENNSLLMQAQAKNLLDYGRIILRDEFYEKINDVSEVDIQDTANEILDEDRQSIIVYKN